MGRNEELLRKRLNLDSWDDFIKKTEDNKFEYKLGKLLELLDEVSQEPDIEGNENLESELEDKTVNDDEGTASRRAEEAKKKEEEQLKKYKKE